MSHWKLTMIVPAMGLAPISRVWILFLPSSNLWFPGQVVQQTEEIARQSHQRG